jgi:hypothetical protein
MLTSTHIIDCLKRFISPLVKNWVLFSNGTYIIFEDSTIIDKKEKAVEIMKEFGSAQADSLSGDMTPIRLSYQDGWTVVGQYYGMYTYVHPSELVELQIINPTDLEVGLFGRQKREKDSRELNVIYVHS